jgi:hypothetical protein
LKRRTGTKWVSYQETPLFCIDFSGYGSDLAGVMQEIEVAEREISRRAPGSLLVAVDLSLTEMMPVIAGFFNRHPGHGQDPIRKMGILGVSGFHRRWYRWVKHVSWPKNAMFFDEYEQIKRWLVAEGF